MDKVTTIPSGARRVDYAADNWEPPRAEDYECLLQISLSLNTAAALNDLLRRILASAKQVMRAEDASIMLLDNSGRRLRFAAIDSRYSESLAKLELDLGEGVAGWVALHKEPLIVPDPYQDPRFSTKGDEASGHRTANMLCVPMQSPHRVVGTLEVINQAADPIKPHDLRLCLSLANIAAIAIENVQLRETEEASLQRLESVLRSRANFLTILSHEFRTPLTVLETGLAVLRDQAAGDAATQETLASMRLNTARLKKLTNDIFVVNDSDSLRGQMKRSRVDLGQLIESFRDYYRPLDAEAPTLTIRQPVKSDAEALTVSADREKIGHCIDHLLDNAHKFSPPGSEVELSVAPDAVPEFVCVTVRDHGIGITDAHRDRIFELFYQVDSSMTRKYGGTGVGLYICRRIVEAHGGKVWCRGLPGGGSEFCLSLPRKRS